MWLKDHLSANLESREQNTDSQYDWIANPQSEKLKWVRALHVAMSFSKTYTSNTGVYLHKENIAKTDMSNLL